MIFCITKIPKLVKTQLFFQSRNRGGDLEDHNKQIPCAGVHFIRNQKKGVKPFSNNPITLSSFRSPARSAGPPAVTRLMKMPSSFSLYGVEPKPPARKK